MAHLHLITVGGTIDKTYGSGLGVRDLHIGPPVAPSILRAQHTSFMGTPLDFAHKELARKDSLDLTDDDRVAIALACDQASATHILITHGTDTMVETARAISVTSTYRRRTIVLTGALLPACVIGSDANFNLGFALAACFTLPQGIYVAMHGLHKWDRCKKNSKTGLFEPTL